jgi:hypothetical protein
MRKKKKTLLFKLIRGVARGIAKGIMDEPSKTRKNAIRRAKQRRRSIW